jgi:hypothetical protein
MQNCHCKTCRGPNSPFDRIDNGTDPRSPKDTAQIPPIVFYHYNSSVTDKRTFIFPVRHPRLALNAPNGILSIFPIPVSISPLQLYYITKEFLCCGAMVNNGRPGLSQDHVKDTTSFVMN